MIDYLSIVIFILGCLSPLIMIAGHKETFDPACRLGQYRWLFLRNAAPDYIAEIAETTRSFKAHYLALGFLCMLLAFVLSATYARYNGLLTWSLGCFTIVFWGKWASKYVSFYHWVYVKHKALLCEHATVDDLKKTDVWLKVVKVIEHPLLGFPDGRGYITDVPLPEQYAPFYYHVVYRPGVNENPVHEMLLCSQKQINHVLFHDPEFVRLVLNEVLHLADVVTGPVTFVPVIPNQSRYTISAGTTLSKPKPPPGRIYFEHQHPPK